MTDNWLCTNVTPNLTSSFGQYVGAILARPLVWACYDPTWSEGVAPEIQFRIIRAFTRLGRDFLEGFNPIRRAKVIASEVGGSVNLDL